MIPDRLKNFGIPGGFRHYHVLAILVIACMVISIALVSPAIAGKPVQPPSTKCKTEVCDGKDNNCDKFIDEGCSMYCDRDTDGYKSTLSTGICSGTGCWTNGTCSYAKGNDCNDINRSINPGAIETCNLIDDNCNNQIDENACIDPASCKELFPGTNNPTADRINVVFAGMLYTDKALFISHAANSVDYYGNLPGTGLEELAIYKDSKNKFNFWYIDKILTPSSSTITSCTQCSSSETSLYCGGLSNKYQVNFCNVDFRGCAYFGGPSYIATSGSYGSNVPYVFSHEFQHQFPRLLDEYVEASLGDRPGAPNCAPDLATATSWWGSLAGLKGTDGRVVGYYDGCSYVSGNYRATDNSMMRSWIFDLGLVNERHVTTDLGTFTGLSGAPANAVEITMSGDPSDASTYIVTDIQPLIFTSPVKKEKDKTDTIEIRVKDEIYSQEFVTYQELVTEDFSSGSSISLVDIKKIPQPAVTVTVPTDTATYNPATKKFDVGTEQGVPFTITIKNNNGKSKEILSSE
jgi:hypothetical protein